MHVLSSFQRTGLASNEPRRLCWRLGNLAILLTLGFFCQPLSEVFFRIFFQRRAAVPGGRALIEVGVANPRFQSGKKICSLSAPVVSGAYLSKSASQPGRVTLGKVSIRTDRLACQPRSISSGVFSARRWDPAQQPRCPAGPFSKERSLTIRVLFAVRKAPGERARSHVTEGFAEYGRRSTFLPEAGTHQQAAPSRTRPSRR